MRRSAAPSRSNLSKDSYALNKAEFLPKPIVTKPSEVVSSADRYFEAVFTKASSKKEGSRVKVGAFEAELMTEANPPSVPSVAPLSVSNKTSNINDTSGDGCAVRKTTDSLLGEPKHQQKKRTIAFTSKLINRGDFSECLIMPKPPSCCVWAQNQEGLPITDVVLETSFASRLRPHQKEGVVFLYRCVMGFMSPNASRDSLVSTDIHVSESSVGGGSNGSKPIYGCILADEMGLGKTVQTIALIWLLLRQGPYGGQPVIHRCLVVTPSSLVQNWAKEVSKWLGRERLPVYCVDAGNTVKQYLQLPSAPPVLIMSYEMFLQHADAIHSIPDLDMVVCDEAHRLKNNNIHTSLALQRLTTAHRRVLLTGTPVQNNLDELRSLAEFCAPGRLVATASCRRHFTAGRRRPENVLHQEEEDEGENDPASSLSSMLSTFLLRRTADVIRSQLPDKNQFIVFCRASPLQDKLETILLSAVRAALSPSSADQENHPPLSQIGLDLGGGQVSSDGGVRPLLPANHWGATGDSILCVITGLRKLYNHPQMFRDYINDSDRSMPKHLIAQLISAIAAAEAEEEKKGNSCRQRVQLTEGTAFNLSAVAASGKLSVLVHMLTRLFPVPISSTQGGVQAKRMRCSHRLVLVSNFTETLDLLETVCTRVTGRTCLRIDGQTPGKRRQEVVQQFNDLTSSLSSDILLLSSRAGGSGLNLTGGDHLILFDMDWNPANDAQAMARIWRPGQTRPVRLYRLITAGGVEERIFQRQTAKSAISVHALDCPLDDLLVDHSSGDGAKKSKSGVLTKAELRDLFLCPRSESRLGCWTHDLIGCTCQQSELPVLDSEIGPLSEHSPTLSSSSPSSRSDRDAGVASDNDSGDDSEVRVCQLGRPTTTTTAAPRSTGSTCDQLIRSGSLACLLGWTHSLSPEAITELGDPLLTGAGDEEPGSLPIVAIFSSVDQPT